MLVPADKAGKMSGRNRASACPKNKIKLGADEITPILVGGKRDEKHKNLKDEQMKKCGIKKSLP